MYVPEFSKTDYQLKKKCPKENLQGK